MAEPLVVNMLEILARVTPTRASLKTGCPAFIPGIHTSYGYEPTLAAGIIFCILFGLSLAGHVVQIARFRRWTSILIAVGALAEFIGWAGRVWAAKCVYNSNAFMIQIVCLILAPVFFSASLYVLLGMFIIQLGRHSSILSARMYTIVFCVCDLISLIAQGAGGGLASAESTSASGDASKGSHIMLGGIIFQLVTMTIFGALFLDFCRRSWGRREITPSMRKVLYAMFIAFAAIYVRSVYRVAELSEGFAGYIITHEVYFCVFDALPMIVAAGIFNILDPAVLMKKTAHVKAALTTEESVITGKEHAGSGSEIHV